MDIYNKSPVLSLPSSDIFQLYSDAWLLHPKSKLDESPLPSVNNLEFSSLMVSRGLLSLIGNLSKSVEVSSSSSEEEEVMKKSTKFCSADYLEILRWVLVEAHIIVAQLSAGREKANAGSGAELEQSGIKIASSDYSGRFSDADVSKAGCCYTSSNK